MVPAKDISKYQGNWQDTGEQIVMIKLGGGDDGLYFDPDCQGDYNGAKADGRHVGCYWFIGWTAGASAEASTANRGMQPWAENDVIALDIENGAVAVPANAPEYVLEMCQYIHNAVGVWPLVYMNLSTLNAHDWSAVLANSGLWLADWAVSPDQTIPTNHEYVMQQFSDGPVYDHDEWFGTVEEFDRYGYHANQPTPTPDPTTTTTTVAPTPDPTTTTTTTEAPTPPDPDPDTTTTTTETPLPPPFTTTSTTSTTTTTQRPDPTVPAQGFWATIFAAIKSFLTWLGGK